MVINIPYHNFHSFVYPRDFAFFLRGKSSSCLATFDNISETEQRKQFRKELFFNFGEKLENKSTDLHARTVKLRITNVGDLNSKPIAGVRFPGRVKTNAVVPTPCRSNESQIARSLPRQVLFCRAGRGR